jgi:hypothetical protein
MIHSNLAGVFSAEMTTFLELAAFQGASASGSIPLTERVLNELANARVSGRSGRIQQLDIQIGRDNYLQIGVKVKVGPFSRWFRPELTIASSVQDRRVVLSVASPQYAGLLWLADLLIKERLPQGLAVRGKDLILDLAAVPVLTAYMAYLRSLQITTERGSLLLSFQVRID